MAFHTIFSPTNNTYAAYLSPLIFQKYFCLFFASRGRTESKRKTVNDTSILTLYINKYQSVGRNRYRSAFIIQRIAPSTLERFCLETLPHCQMIPTYDTYWTEPPPWWDGSVGIFFLLARPVVLVGCSIVRLTCTISMICFTEKLTIDKRQAFNKPRPQ